VLALRDENERLRGENDRLTAEVSAMRAAQADLAKHLRMTAPLRRVQERLRLRASEGRRQAQTPTRQEGRSWGTPDATASLAAIPEDYAARHPLVARTRVLISGGELTPAADMRPLATGRGGRVAVVVHVYYPELWPELAERIERIPPPIDLVVTLVTGRSEGLGDAIVAQFPDVLIEVVPNRGRDMWPFVRVLELGLVGDHDAVLKLHTKASVHRVDGAAWRARLLDSLCPGPERIGLMLELLGSDDRVGAIGPAGGVLGREFWGSNGPLLDALAVRTGVDVDPDRVWFPGGSMFWARPGPLLPLRAAGLAIEDFEHEAVSIDGTTAHALERFVGALVAHAGQEMIAADEVAGRLARVQGSSGIAPPSSPA
jgi:lipopolysaccharide biosynthesis protein